MLWIVEESLREAFRVIYFLGRGKWGGEILVEPDRFGQVHVTLRSIIGGDPVGRPIRGFPGLHCWIAPNLVPMSDELFFRSVRIKKGSYEWLRFEQTTREKGTRYVRFAASES